MILGTNCHEKDIKNVFGDFACCNCCIFCYKLFRLRQRFAVL